MGSRSAYVHVGLPKTGTSYIQRAMWQNKDALADRGVHVPGGDSRAQRAAFWDLLGRRIEGGDARAVEGAWAALASSAASATAPRLLVSEELLVLARQRHARTVAEAFEPRELHVVVTIRDLARAIASMWQQEMAKGRTIGWTDFVRAVRSPDEGPATAGVGFWIRYDAVRVLDAWSAVVPPERVHVVTVPPAGVQPTVLLERFASAIGFDVSGLVVPETLVHEGLSGCHAEVLRRLNGSLREQLTDQQYRDIVRRLLVPAARHDDRRLPIEFPEAYRDWVRDRSDEVIAALQEGGYELTGSWSDLRPVFGHGPALNPDDVSDAELSAATLALLAGILSLASRAGRSRPRPAAALGTAADRQSPGLVQPRTVGPLQGPRPGARARRPQPAPGQGGQRVRAQDARPALTCSPRNRCPASARRTPYCDVRPRAGASSSIGRAADF